MLNTKEGGDYINANVIKVRMARSSYRKEPFSMSFVVGSAFPLIVDNSVILAWIEALCRDLEKSTIA